YEISTGQDRLAFPELPTRLAESADQRQFLELNSIIAKCCHFDPRKRYQRARDVYADLAALQRGRSIKLRRAVPRNLQLASRTGAICLVIGLLACLYFWWNSPSEERVVMLRPRTSQPRADLSHPELKVQPPSPLVFPPRDASADPNQIDLTSFYNAR